MFPVSGGVNEIAKLTDGNDVASNISLDERAMSERRLNLFFSLSLYFQFYNP